MANKFYLDISDFVRKNEEVRNKIGPAIRMIWNTEAPRVESYMKSNRPWIDRTGLAKLSLSARVSQPNPNLIRMTLAHGVEYGIWLELAHEKKYAIVAPTLKMEGPRVIGQLQNLMSKIGR